jgi:hypothetical protein
LSTRSQIYLSDEQRRRIDELVAAEGVTMAEIIRLALDGYLDDQAEAEPVLAATFGCGSGFLSARTETNGIVADFLVDTVTIVDYLRGARRFEAMSHRTHYSVVTRAELFAGKG